MSQPNKYRLRFWPFPIFILAAGLILGGAVKFLWNAILPSLLNINTISYWQAVGLLVLCRILLGNFGGRMNSSRHRWQGKWEPNSSDSESENEFFKGPPWRRKWMNMSDEDRVKFKEEMRRRCGRRPEKE